MLREFYLDIQGIIINLKYNNKIEPDIVYKYGRKVYLLSPGHYQLIFELSGLEKMSKHAKEKCIPYINPKYRVVDIVITDKFFAYRRPEKIIKIEALLNN
jgi:hypothetical protein